MKRELPTIFTYRRSLDLSHGQLRSFDSKAEPRVYAPLIVTEVGVLGTVSNYSDGYGKKEDVDRKLESPNPQTIDACFLPPEHDSMELTFSLVVGSNALEVDACNNNEMADAMVEFAKKYKAIDGFTTPAKLYAWNIANGRPLWRNREGVDKKVTITYVDRNTSIKEVFMFNADEIDIVDPSEFIATPDGIRLGDIIASGLRGDVKVSLTVNMTVTKGYFGHEVFPSQDFINNPNPKLGEKCKYLSSIVRDGKRCAQMHPQKIGNAIRTIDIWHEKVAMVGPTAIEPLGVAVKKNMLVRTTGKTDVYSYFEQIDDFIENANNGILLPDSHYLAACLVRGNVFNGAKESEAAKAEKAAVKAEKAVAKKAEQAATKAEKEEAKKAALDDKNKLH